MVVLVGSSGSFGDAECLDRHLAPPVWRPFFVAHVLGLPEPHGMIADVEE